MLTTTVIAMANLMMVVMIVVNLTTFVLITITTLLISFTGSYDCTVRLWDVSTYREVAVLKCHTKIIPGTEEYIEDLGQGCFYGVASVAFNGSGKYLASGEAKVVTCGGNGDVDNNHDCNSACYDAADDYLEHGHVCA